MLSSTWESAGSVHYAPRAGRSSTCHSNPATRELWGFRVSALPGGGGRRSETQCPNPPLSVPAPQGRVCKCTYSFSPLRIWELQSSPLQCCAPNTKTGRRMEKHNCHFVSLLLSELSEAGNQPLLSLTTGKQRERVRGSLPPYDLTLSF